MAAAATTPTAIPALALDERLVSSVATIVAPLSEYGQFMGLTHVVSLSRKGFIPGADAVLEASATSAVVPVVDDVENTAVITVKSVVEAAAVCVLVAVAKYALLSETASALDTLRYGFAKFVSQRFMAFSSLLHVSYRESQHQCTSPDWQNSWFFPAMLSPALQSWPKFEHTLSTH